MKNKFLFFLTVVISLIIGFLIGYYYQRNRRNFFVGNQFNIQGRQAGFSSGLRPITGEIIKKDNDSLVVKLKDNSTKVIFLTDKTTISKSIKGDLNDLKEKETVFVIGQQNNDGSITAENIQIGNLTNFPRNRVRSQ